MQGFREAVAVRQQPFVRGVLWLRSKCTRVHHTRQVAVLGRRADFRYLGDSVPVGMPAGEVSIPRASILRTIHYACDLPPLVLADEFPGQLIGGLRGHVCR